MDKLRITKVFNSISGKHVGFELKHGINGETRTVSKDKLIELSKRYEIQGATVCSNGAVRVDRGIPRCTLKKNNKSLKRKEYNKRIRENIRKEEATANMIKENMINSSTKLLFHGSINGIHGEIDCNKNISSTCDFGSGFYLGEDIRQAENRVANRKNSIVYAYTYDFSNCKVYEFDDELLWALYVGRNRKDKIMNKLGGYKKIKDKFDYIDSHDVVIGLIADDKIAKVYDDFLSNRITIEALKECLKLVKYGRQYAIKNNNAVKKSIKEFNKYKITNKMRKDSLEWSRHIREDMDNRIEEIIEDKNTSGNFIKQCLEWYK